MERFILFQSTAEVPARRKFLKAGILLKLSFQEDEAKRFSSLREVRLAREELEELNPEEVWFIGKIRRIVTFHFSEVVSDGDIERHQKVWGK